MFDFFKKTKKKGLAYGENPNVNDQVLCVKWCVEGFILEPDIVCEIKKRSSYEPNLLDYHLKKNYRQNREDIIYNRDDANRVLKKMIAVNSRNELVIAQIHLMFGQAFIKNESK